ncbi:hypothetical protein TrispH2_007135 [Trichoplax sp. H2]|nr:hypothetical protein TrispH2_007135 [Trichoplax sp. H2]|eukprot:RDD40182.1 hypothetical protein TrispH2_007135 [Trichoplax sp. H2]
MPNLQANATRKCYYGSASHYCLNYQYCCGYGCCTFVWHVWYFWFLLGLFFTFLTLLGLCIRRRRLATAQYAIVNETRPTITTTTTTTGYGAVSPKYPYPTSAPPQYKV